MAGTGGLLAANAGLAAKVMGIVPVAVPVALVMVTVHVPVVVDDCSVNTMRPSEPMVFAAPPTMPPPMFAETLTVRPCATWFRQGFRLLL